MLGTVAELRNLRAHYVTEAYGVHRTVYAIDDISLQLRAGEIYGIAGESGCGKTTLLKVLLGQVTPPLTVVDGSVHYMLGGETIDLLSLPEKKRRALRWSAVSYIPQGSMHVLNPVRRIRDTFRDFLAAHDSTWTNDRVGAYLRELGLAPSVLGAFPHQLSGGMRQRVTIALATILSPSIVLADEPTTALDVVVQRGVIQLLDDVRKRTGTTLVLVTHDMGVHANLADRIAVLYAGNLIEEADTATLFDRPRHPYTQYLIQSLPRLDDTAERVSIAGRPPALDNPPAGCRFHPRCPLAMDICRTVAPKLVQVGAEHRVACHLVEMEQPRAA